MGIVTVDDTFSGKVLLPGDVTEWLRMHGWIHAGSLGSIAQRWQKADTGVVVPMLASSPDFGLRWSEMLRRLARSFDTDPAGVLLAVAKSGSDIAEFRASGQIDDSLPLGDAASFIDSVRRAMQASANSALAPRGYFGHSLPDAARDHARGVRMGQTRRGSYIVPVISRLPILEPDDEEDAVLFDEATFQPFARTAMLTLARGLKALRDLTHEDAAPARSRIVEAVGAGVSYELCDAVIATLDTESISDLDVSFTWAERLPIANETSSLRLESAAIPLLRMVGSFLKGEPVIGRQTVVGYVKGLDHGEEDEIGRITLRMLDHDKARNVRMTLNEDDYNKAGVANTGRRMVSATGVLHREPGRALRVTDVSDFHLLEPLPSVALDDATD